MPIRNLFIITLIFSILFFVNNSHTCSTFCLDNNGDPIFGKNYDWSIDDGLLIVNKRGVTKTAMVPENPAKWISKYGSVTFNQFGRELPSGGMNEAGLVIELMWLNGTQYPAADSRAEIGNLQWIQYQLDSHSTVEEVISSDSTIRISPDGAATIHYLVCDKTGNCASIEFIAGKLTYHTNETMPVKVLTNSTYEESIEYLKQHLGFGGNVPVKNTIRSLDRFARAATLVKRFDPQKTDSAIDCAFDALTNVGQGVYTKWSIVYDIANQRIYFRTCAYKQTRFIEFQSLDFTCKTPSLCVDLNAPLSGDINDKLLPATFDINRDLIYRSFRNVDFLRDTPDEALNTIARYSESTKCMDHDSQDPDSK